MALGEGEVGTAGPEGIEYGAVTSCLTATLLLDNGNHVGGHFSLVQAPGAYASNEVLSAMLSLIPSDATVIMVHVAGVLPLWNSAYFTEPLWVGVGEAADVNPAYAGNVPGPDDVASYISYALAGGIPATSEEREGAFTITLGQ
jgi:hypothetical protein